MYEISEKSEKKTRNKQLQGKNVTSIKKRKKKHITITKKTESETKK